MRVACIGEAMIELSLTGTTAQVGVAGDTLNTAIYLKRAAPEIEVDYITRVGRDPFSDRIVDFIAGEGIGVDRIARDPAKTPGLYAITTDPRGERSFTYWRASSAARDLFSEGDFSRLQGYDALYLSGISLAILPPSTRQALIDNLGQNTARVIYDSNHRPRLWEDADTARLINARMWSLAQVVLPSLDDEMALTGEAAEEVMARFARHQGIGALKRGEAGPLSIGAAVTQDYAPAESVVDTTAAGDSFNGAYIAAHLTGASQAEALMAGHRCARQVVGHKGAILPAGA